MNNKMTIDLKEIGISFLTIYMLTCTLYLPLFNSLLLHLVVLLGVLAILAISGISRNKIYFIKKTDFLFWFAILAILFSVFSYEHTSLGEITRPLALCLVIIMSLMLRVDVQNYRIPIFMMKWAAVFFALSVLIQYLFPGFYNRFFLSNLSYYYVDPINNAMENGYYTGFTAQVAYTAGYIVQGIGIIFCVWLLKKRTLSKSELFLLILMIVGLLLTQKRAHILFLALSLIVVYIQFSSFSLERLKKIFKVSLVAILSVWFFFLLFLTGVGESLFARIVDTYQAFVDGEDITSNRWPLWLHAVEIFKQNTLFGIGWGNFSDTVVGRVTQITEMETHNVYLQLLSETGIIGAILILAPMFITYVYTLRVTRYLGKSKDNYSNKWVFAVLYSLFIQTFFLLYGITGNTLYDFSYFTMYFISLGLIYSFKNYTKVKGSKSIKATRN